MAVGYMTMLERGMEANADLGDLIRGLQAVREDKVVLKEPQELREEGPAELRLRPGQRVPSRWCLWEMDAVKLVLEGPEEEAGEWDQRPLPA